MCVCCCCCSVTKSCLAFYDPMDGSMPGLPVPHITHSLPKFMSTESVMLSNHLILCRPLLLLPSIFPSIKVFFNESALHIRWPKYRSFNLSISPSNEYSELIFFTMDWFDLLVVQGTPKHLLTHINSLTLCLLYCPDLTSLHHYWKDHSLDYIDLCQQSDVFSF